MKIFKKLFGIDKLEDKIKGLEDNVEEKSKKITINEDIYIAQEKRIKYLEKTLEERKKDLGSANFSIKKAIARNIIASENEKNYFLGFLGKERLQDFSSFYEKNKIQLEDMTHQILRNFLKGGKRDSETYSAAQEIAEAYMSFFAGSYGETQTPLGQDEDVLTND